MKRCTALVLAITFHAAAAWTLDLQTKTIETKLVPNPATYSVLLPGSYGGSSERYPLFLFLHGGGGDNGFLKRFVPIFENLWKSGAIPEMIVATPDADRSFYLDYKDGSQKWETFIVQDLLSHLKSNYRIAADPKRTFIGGISMGGMGSLRMAFKNPDLFGAVVSFEPGIEPAFEWKDVKLEDKFWRSTTLLEERYGKPFDEKYYAANNPATIVRDHPARILDSGLAIYIEAGSEDSFGLDRGAEFLHRVLYDNGIKHEYRYVRGADHVGASLVGRVTDGLLFLNRVVNPLEEGPAVTRLKRQIRNWKRAAGLRE